MNGKSGQAIAEFVVAIVGVVLIVAAMIQFGLLEVSHTKALQEARKQAGEHALQPILGGPAPSYIQAWDKGPDGSNFSSDDASTDGNIFLFQIALVNAAHTLEIMNYVPDNMISLLHFFPYEVMDGLQNGSFEEDQPVMPIMEEMVFGADTLTVKADVWMTAMGDIY